LDFVGAGVAGGTQFACDRKGAGGQDFLQIAVGFNFAGHFTSSSLTIFLGPPSRLVDQSFKGWTGAKSSSWPSSITLEAIKCQMHSISLLISQTPFEEPRCKIILTGNTKGGIKNVSKNLFGKLMYF
jgi:hypothetical protein